MWKNACDVSFGTAEKKKLQPVPLGHCPRLGGLTPAAGDKSVSHQRLQIYFHGDSSHPKLRRPSREAASIAPSKSNCCRGPAAEPGLIRRKLHGPRNICVFSHCASVQMQKRRRTDAFQDIQQRDAEPVVAVCQKKLKAPLNHHQ